MGRMAQRGFNLLVLGLALFVASSSRSKLPRTGSGIRCSSILPRSASRMRFNENVGFFMFKLGFLEYIYGWMFFALIVAALATAGVHYIDGDRLPGRDADLRSTREGAPLPPIRRRALREGLGIPAGCVQSALLSIRQVFGAGYTDVHARLFAFKVLSVVAAISGILALVNINRRGIKFPAAALIILVGASLILGVFVPGFVQQVYVEPNEIARESEFIGNNIKSTRYAFNLDRISVKDFPATNNLTSAGPRATARPSTVSAYGTTDPS